MDKSRSPCWGRHLVGPQPSTYAADLSVNSKISSRFDPSSSWAVRRLCDFEKIVAGHEASIGTDLEEETDAGATVMRADRSDGGTDERERSPKVFGNVAAPNDFW